MARRRIPLIIAALILLAAPAPAQEPLLQEGDFLVGTNHFAHGAIVRVRAGEAAPFCEAQTDRPWEAGFFYPPKEVLIDPQGRVVFIAMLEQILNRGSWGLFRCDAMDAPPTLLGAFGSSDALGYPRPLGSRPVRFAAGLHLKRTAGINLNTGSAADKTYYVFAVANGPGEHIDMLSYDPDTGDWGDFGLMDDPVQNINLDDLDIINGGDGINNYTISVADHQIKVVAEPMRVEFDLSGVLTVAGAFQLTGELALPPLDDRTVPFETPHSCLIPLPGAPRNEQGSTNVFTGVHGIAWTPEGAVAVSGSGAAGHPFLPRLSLELFNIDPSDDDAMLFVDPFSPTCAIVRKINHTPWHPFNSWNDSTGKPRAVDQMTANGTAGTQRREGRIVGLGPGEVVVLAESANWSEFGPPFGIDVYPGYVPARAGLAMFVKIESPVDVVVVAPDGRRIGVSAGSPVNDFGPGGFDSNTIEPRIFGIRQPLPGDYTIETVGTGTGLYHVTVYGVNLETMAVTWTQLAGETQPSLASTHGINLNAAGTVTTIDHVAPQIVGVADMSVEASGPSTPVDYESLGVIDDIDPSPVLTCLPASGALFVVGITVVNCTAFDAAGNTSTASFNVTVTDTMPPVLALPANIVTTATSAAGAIVQFTAGAADLVDGTVAVGCTPPSGSTFPVGATAVTCEATDAHGNQASGSFSITVSPVTAPANHAPQARRDRYTVRKGGVLVTAAPGVLANDRDRDGDVLSAVLVSGPAHGTLSFLADGSFVYRPAPGYAGHDRFIYQAQDGSGALSRAATVVIAVKSKGHVR